MKKCLTLSLMLALSVAASAQLSQPIQGPKNQVVQQLLNRNTTRTAAKTTVVKERLLAQNRYAYNNGAFDGMDTVRHWYNSNTRGSSFDFNDMEFRFPNGAYGFIDLTVNADSSVYLFDDNTGQGLVFYTNAKVAYTATNKPASVTTIINGAQPDWRQTYTYNAQDKATETLLEIKNNSGQWRTRAKFFYTYNVQGNVLTDSIAGYDTLTNAWIPGIKTVYTYDASGMNILSILTAGALYTNTYYPDNRLKTSVYHLLDTSGNAIPLILDSFGYTGNNNYYSYYYEAEPDTAGVFQPVYLQTRHINAQNLPDTLYAQYPLNGQWQVERKGYYTYTSYGNPEHYTFYKPASGSANPDFTGNYYYELYNDPTSVAAISAIAQDMQLYPNPAADLVNINWKNAVAGTPVTITITDMQGRLIRHESFKWSEPVQHLSLAGLQTGVYNLAITGSGGEQLFCRQVVKQ